MGRVALSNGNRSIVADESGAGHGPRPIGSTPTMIGDGRLLGIEYGQHALLLLDVETGDRVLHSK